MQNDTQKLYQQVLKGAQMGVSSIDEMLKRCDDSAFQQALLQTQNGYKEIAQEADAKLQQAGGIPRELPAHTRISTSFAVSMQTMADRSPKRMAKMVLTGMDMGDAEMAEELADMPHASDEARELASRLSHMQDKQRNLYERYLS